MAPDQIDPLTPDLRRYLAIRDQQRADQVARRLGRFTDRELALVREAAVHGWVLGVLQAGGGPRHILSDSQILGRVVLGCTSQSDLYPLIGEHQPASSEEASSDG